jgi:soluble lytic murein transglycosylase-like protein
LSFFSTPKQIIFVFALSAGFSAPAAAQIYTWRDANGNLVLSDHRPQGDAVVQSYAVPQSEGVRTTRSVSTGRTDAFDDLIRDHSRLNGVRPALVRAVVQVESAFNPNARSSKGAMGLMQLMPTTAREFGVHNPFNPAENLRAGVAYLRQLLDRYGNNEKLALAAYNAGPNAVDRHGQSVPPYRETVDYVSKVDRIAGRVAQVATTRIYRTVDVVDGREVVKYTDRKPN